MGPLPVGTLTLLFSDIEGSTTLLTRLGPRWGEALSEHRAILRDAFVRHGGREVGTEGDSFFVVFTSAPQAVAAAVAAQRALGAHEWPDGRPLRVRIGLHTGQPELHEDDYIGLDVHRAARIMATAHGGQVVMSQATHTLVSGALRDETVRDLGWHRLKDLPQPEHLYEVVGPGMPAEHPPLRSLGVVANLPGYPTELVGRDADLRAVVAAFETDGARLVTVTGPGGTGKTRLSVAVATELHTRSPRDVYFVPLQTSDRAELMWAAIGEAVGSVGSVGSVDSAVGPAEQTPEHRALAFLRERSALIVLDNLEQITDAHHVVAGLLGAAPRVAVLATSRRPLHLAEEWQYPLSALPLPPRRPRDGQGTLAPDEAEQSPAVKLFVERARMVRPGFALSEDNVGAIAELCRRLDGLPLAIELAAARSRLLGPRALLAHLDSWFGEATPAADRPERQRTLAATISWSYDMLTDEERRVFRQLSVFAGPVGMDAVHAVVAQDRDPLEVVSRLVDASLLEAREGPDGEPLVHLLETIRWFAGALLERHGESEAARLRHAEWCIRVAHDSSSLLNGPRQMAALDRIQAVIEDVRAALDWTLSPDATGDRFERGLELLQPMDRYWYRFGYVQEGRGWSDRAMAVLGRRGLEDSPHVVDALHGHGVFALQQNDVATGARTLERALGMAQRLGDVAREARESNSLGIARREQGDVDAAHALIERSIELARRAGDTQREATALSNLVHIHLDRGEYSAAVTAALRAAAADEARQDPWGAAIDRTNLVNALLHAEGPRPALEKLVEFAPTTVGLGDIDLSISVVESFAAIRAALGDGRRAAALLGAADRHRESAGLPRPVPDAALLDRCVAPARAHVEPVEWDRAYAAGRELTIDAAVAEGLGAASDDGRHQSAEPPPEGGAS